METSLVKAFHFLPGLSSKKSLEKAFHHLLGQADIRVNGNRAWDLKLHHSQFFRRVWKEGSLGLGESYMDGWWDVSCLDDFFYRVFKNGLDEKGNYNFQSFILWLTSRLFNLQSKKRAGAVADKHYDIGNDLYRAMLDPYMIYSCGYWKNASTLEEAQLSKLDLVCRKLNLKRGMTLLDIGCGWGGMVKFAAENYGVRVVGITISQEQCKLAQKICQGLPIEIRLQDYRTLNQPFDRIVSIGMFEHVGYKNYKTFMKVTHRCLKEDGLFLLHTIGSNRSFTCTDAWIHRYIFPNSHLPSAKQITESLEDLFVMEDWHNFGSNYDQTLLSWHANFCENWPKLKHNYGPRFYRMWTYYLLACAGLFRARKNQLWQIMLSKKGIKGGYSSLR